jgi:hypothetical protein
MQHADHWHRWLLRVRRERPCHSAAESGYQFRRPTVTGM